MAYVNSTRIDPRDLQKNTAIGVRLPFNAGGVFTSTYATKDQIKYNLINLLLTSKGERVENPEFGSSLRDNLFDNVGGPAFDLIKEGINESVQLFLPEIKVTNISITQNPNYNENTVVVEITYQILISGETDNVTINFEE